jgi:hypothetical protein
MLQFEIWTNLGNYAGSSSNALTTFRDNLFVPSSVVFLTLNMEPISCPETSVKDYHSSLRNIPEERRCHQHRRGSLKSRMLE